MIFIIIGFILVYESLGILILERIREQRKIKWFDWIIAFIPIVRGIYMMIEIEVKE